MGWSSSLVFVQDLTLHYKYTTLVANNRVQRVLRKLCCSWTTERSSMCSVGLSERLQKMQVWITFSVVCTISPFGKHAQSPSGQTSPTAPWVWREQDERSVFFLGGSPQKAALQQATLPGQTMRRVAQCHRLTLGPQIPYRSSQFIFLNPFLVFFKYFFCLLFYSKCACYPHSLRLWKTNTFIHINMEW